MIKLTFRNKCTQVLALMKKDVVFNYKFLLIGIVALILLVVSIAFDKEAQAPIFMMTIFGPMFTISAFTSRVMYVDDTYHTRFFLQSLPMKKGLRIFAKYLLVLISILGFVFGNALLIAVFGVPVVWSYVIIVLSAMLVFYSVMLYVFHVYNANMANNTYAFCLLGMYPVMKIMENASFNEATLSIPTISMIALMFGLVLYCISMLLSMKKEGATGSAVRKFALGGFNSNKNV